MRATATLTASEVAIFVEEGPGDPGHLVGEHLVMQSSLPRRNPVLEPAAFPPLWVDQSDPSRLDEHDAQAKLALNQSREF
jgi:hypothetical protein